jgi:hypothetical protein
VARNSSLDRAARTIALPAVLVIIVGCESRTTVTVTRQATSRQALRMTSLRRRERGCLVSCITWSRRATFPPQVDGNQLLLPIGASPSSAGTVGGIVELYCHTVPCTAITVPCSHDGPTPGSLSSRRRVLSGLLLCDRCCLFAMAYQPYPSREHRHHDDDDESDQKQLYCHGRSMFL